MKLSHFNYELPKELIAEFPTEQRDESRLMVIDRAKQTIEHKTFKNFIDYFGEGDTLAMNNTKVFPARLYGQKEKTGRKLRFFCFVSSTKNKCCGMFWLTQHEKFAWVTSFILAMMSSLQK